MQHNRLLIGFQVNCSAVLPGEVAGICTGPNTELDVAQSRFCWDANEIRHHKSHKIRRHDHRCLVVVPNVSWHSVTTKIYIQSIIISIFILNSKNGFGSYFWDLIVCLFLFGKTYTYIGTVLISGILLLDVMDSFRPSVAVKLALKAGSSKQGNERRASVASNCVTAKYLFIEEVTIK